MAIGDAMERARRTRTRARPAGESRTPATTETSADPSTERVAAVSTETTAPETVFDPRLQQAMIEYFARTDRGERPEGEPQEKQSHEEAIAGVKARYNLSDAEAKVLSRNVKGESALEDEEDAPGGARPDRHARPSRGETGTAGDRRERIRATQRLLEANKFEEHRVKFTAGSENINRAYWTRPDDDSMHIILGNGDVAVFERNQAHNFNFRNDTNPVWRTWKGKDTGLADSSPEEINGAPKDWPRLPLETLSAPEFTSAELAAEQDKYHKEREAIGSIVRNANLPSDDEVDDIWGRLSRNRQEIDRASTSEAFEEVKRQQMRIRALVDEKIAASGGARPDKDTPDTKPKDTVEPPKVPEGTPVDIESRKLMLNGDEFTHVLLGDTWEPISDGQEISAYRGSENGKIFIKNGRKEAEFVPNEKGKDDTTDGKEKDPPKTKKSAAEIEKLRKKMNKKWGTYREEGDEEKPDPKKAARAGENIDVSNLPASWQEGVRLRGPEAWKQEQERPLIQIPPQRPAAPLTRFFRRLFGIYERDPILEQQLTGNKTEAEKADIRAREALTLGSLGISADAQDRSLKEQWKNVRDKLHLEGVARTVLISAGVVTVLASAVGTGGLSLGWLGGVIAGKIARNVIEKRQKKDGETGKLATFKRLAGSSIIGFGAGVAIGLATGTLDWSGIWDRLTGGGTSGPSNAPVSPPDAAVGGKVPPFFDKLDASVICDNSDSVWRHFRGGLEDIGFLKGDPWAQDAVTNAFHRTIDTGRWHADFLSLNGKPLEDVDWRFLKKGTIADYGELFDNPDFKQQFCATIERSYPTLAQHIRDSGVDVKGLVRNLSLAYGVK